MNRILVGAVVAFAAFAFVLSSAAVGTSHGAAVQNGSSVAPGTCTQSLVNLGTAGHFRVLAGSTVTNTGLTVVHGDVGVSPGTAITGFPPGVVVGTIHANDTNATAAQKDLLTAYNAASLRTNCAVNITGNLGGSTLRPGLYVSTSSLSISSANLTLDAHGHPNAVFVFVIASTFTTSTGLGVTLAGGANATHIFWIVGSSATLATSSSVSGTIIASASITLTTGATLHGRALALNGAVTLDTNQVRR